jgi:hypothetical protein
MKRNRGETQIRLGAPCGVAVGVCLFSLFYCLKQRIINYSGKASGPSRICQKPETARAPLQHLKKSTRSFPILALADIHVASSGETPIGPSGSFGVAFSLLLKRCFIL